MFSNFINQGTPCAPVDFTQCAGSLNQLLDKQYESSTTSQTEHY